jgi:hypothetical protein
MTRPRLGGPTQYPRFIADLAPEPIYRGVCMPLLEKCVDACHVRDSNSTSLLLRGPKALVSLSPERPSGFGVPAVVAERDRQSPFGRHVTKTARTGFVTVKRMGKGNRSDSGIWTASSAASGFKAAGAETRRRPWHVVCLIRRASDSNLPTPVRSIGRTG